MWLNTLIITIAIKAYHNNYTFPKINNIYNNNSLNSKPLMEIETNRSLAI